MHDSKLADMSDRNIPGGVLLEQPSADLLTVFDDRKRRVVQDAKLGHLAEEEVPGAVLVEHPTPSLRHGYRQKS
jgi:hypothetical protein